MLPEFLLIAAYAFTQTGTFSAHHGWSVDDTLQSATDIVVADILDGAGLDGTPEATASARVRVVRVLSGDLAPEAALALKWRYRPAVFEAPAGALPRTRALWFLNRQSGGGFAALQVAGGFEPFGGFFVELPSTAVPYPADIEPRAKIAREAAAALEDLAIRRAADFEPHRVERPAPGAMPPWVRTRMRFQSLAMLLQALGKDASGVYRDFSASPDGNLKLLGLCGRIGAGDGGAVLELEQDLPRLAAVSTGTPLMGRLGAIDLRRNLPAAHALARMALSETTLPGLESFVAMSLGQTGSIEFAPYLVVMLSSPDPASRGGALRSLCALAPSAGGAASCPDAIPMSDRQEELRDIQFWQLWWESHRDEIAQTTPLPSPAAPSRYAAAPRYPVSQEIPIEVRFESLLRRGSEQATHSHDESGAMVAEPPAVHDPVASRLGGDDQAVWRQLVSETNAKLADCEKRVIEIMKAGSLTGKEPPPEKLHALEQERRSILKAALETARSRLSPEGWQTLDDLLNQIRGGVMMQQVPAPN